MRRSASFASTSASVNCEPDQRDVGLVREQIGHRADVVLVPVGEHDRLHVVEPVENAREVGQDQVDTGLVDVGEQHSTVDDEKLAGVFEDGHVATDLAEPAQRGHPQPAVGQRRWWNEILMCSNGHSASPGRSGAVVAGRLSPAAAQSSRSWAISAAVASTSGDRTGPAGRSSRFNAAFVRITPWVRKKP